MPIIPSFEPPNLGRIVTSATKSADIASGGLLGQAAKLAGIDIGIGPMGQDSRIGQTGTLSKTGERPTATSSLAPQWGGLNENLLARLFVMNFDGSVNEAEGEVIGPITETQFEATMNWQSPFENTGPESKAPALMALLQTGQIATIANMLQAVLPTGSMLGDFASEAAQKTESWAKELTGRTGITKLNSRQVFAGMPPIKLNVTMHFRALDNPVAQVEEPYKKLLSWALPQYLAPDGLIGQLITGSDGFIKAMFPSKAPLMVGVRYGRNRFSPMVIESIGNPMDGPITEQGIPVYRAVNLTLATLTALDRGDVAKIFGGR